MIHLSGEDSRFLWAGNKVNNNAGSVPDSWEPDIMVLSDGNNCKGIHKRVSIVADVELIVSIA